MALTIRICENCGAEFAFREAKNRPGRFCSKRCYYTSGAPRSRASKGQKMRSVPGHAIAPRSGIVAVARLVLYEKIGHGVHACHWCGEPVKWMPGEGLAVGALIADHLDWDRANDSPENLVPSCNTCNAHRTRTGDRRIIQKGEAVAVRDDGRRRRAYERTCQVCGIQFFAPTDAVKRGGGKTCSRKCSGKLGHAVRWGA